MGRVGAAGDNAAMENFFALLQKNVLDRRPWRTRNELPIAYRDLDRAHLPPQTAPDPPGPIDARRVRNHHGPSHSTRCVNPNCHPITQQSRGPLQ